MRKKKREISNNVNIYYPVSIDRISVDVSPIDEFIVSRSVFWEDKFSNFRDKCVLGSVRRYIISLLD